MLQVGKLTDREAKCLPQITQLLSVQLEYLKTGHLTLESTHYHYVELTYLAHVTHKPWQDWDSNRFY